ncbi:MFS transporter [Aquimarina sp. Aq78]|uniref:MFS transporter n=1 Tax=Aquimarina sp. Aq78 TaxID=1191889 RepID=UPI000D108275|nr:MFS transporter [Aquimarina sp. Aq78]
MKKYYVYLGLLMFSIFGTDLTDFALSVWILDQPEGSITIYSMIWFFEAAPAIFLAPVIGGLVDRWNKKKMIIYGQLIAGCGSLTLMTLYYLGNLVPWHIMIVAGIGSIASMFVFNAFYISTTALVPKNRLVNAQGASSTIHSIIQMGVPILAPVLYKLIGLKNIFFIDAVTFFVSVISFSILSFVVVAQSEEKFSLKADFLVVKEFMNQKKGFIYLFSFFFLTNFLIGLITVLLTPLILDFSDEYVLGIVLAVVGSGSLIGGIIMSSTKGIKKPIQVVIWANVIVGLTLCSFFIQINPYILAIGGMLILAMFSISGIANDTFFQTVVPVDLLGRLTGVGTLVIGAAAPIAFLLSGFVVDKLSNIFKNFSLQILNRFPGTSITTSIIIVFVISGALLTIISLVYRKNKSLQDLDRLYFTELNKHQKR